MLKISKIQIFLTEKTVLLPFPSVNNHHHYPFSSFLLFVPSFNEVVVFVKMASSSGMGDGSYGDMGGDQGSEQFQGKNQQGDGQKTHLEIHTGKPFRLQVKVAIPIKEHPNFNFVGKLLGPKGASLKQLQEVTQTRMAILGRGSMRDKKKEEELRTGGEPKYAHLNDELHVEISALAPPSEAYRRVAHAIDELSRFLVPDYNDDGRGFPPPHEMAMNGRGGQKPGFGFDDPTMGAARPPPGPIPPPARGAAFWSPARGGGGSRRVLQPRPAASAPRRAPPSAAPPAADYSYDDSYGRYDAGGASADYYGEPGMDGGDGGYGADDYSGGPARSFPRPRAHPYAASARPY